MGLRRKTFLYSITLAVMMVVFIIGYFIVMLPSLYVDYVMRSNLDSVVEIQQSYMRDRDYGSVAVRNPSSTFSMEIPDKGNEIYLAGTFFKLTVRIQEEGLQELLDDTRDWMGGLENMPSAGEWNQGEDNEEFKALAARWERIWKERFAGQDFLPQDYPVKIELHRKDVPMVYQGEYSKVHVEADNVIVYECGVKDGDYSYTSYLAMGRTGDAFIMTVMATMTPRMEEITPVVSGSLPMILAVIFLAVFISSRFFSGRIVNPIVALANRAQNAWMSGSFEPDGFMIDSQDEIGALSRNLQELYGKLRDNCEELEHKNQILEEEKERQEVFLRASSHQLKTPVAAALLLVEGMMHEVGRYQDTKAYLPEVKKQLLSMRRIVEDILYLNHCADHMQTEKVDLRVLAEEAVGNHGMQAESRGLCMEVVGNGCAAADREMLRIVVDNLLSNAVQYTPGGQRIVVRVEERDLRVTNYGVQIEQALLPNILEPFVSSDRQQKGKGLGLYVASYYCRRMGCGLTVGNIEDGVEARITFGQDTGKSTGNIA